MDTRCLQVSGITLEFAMILVCNLDWSYALDTLNKIYKNHHQQSEYFYRWLLDPTAWNFQSESNIRILLSVSEQNVMHIDFMKHSHTFNKICRNCQIAFIESILSSSLVSSSINTIVSMSPRFFQYTRALGESFFDNISAESLWINIKKNVQKNNEWLFFPGEEWTKVTLYQWALPECWLDLRMIF